MTTFRVVPASAIRAGLICGAFLLSQTAWLNAAHAKLPGMVHCFNEICHRVRTVEETAARRGIIEPVVASFYDSPANDRFNPRSETSSGAMFDADTPDNAASPIHPDGTVLLIWSPATRGAAVVRVNNAGPYYHGRTLDVSRGTAEKIGFSKGGVMQLLSVVISAPSEPDARYQRGRTYPKVRGYLGTFDNLALASLEDHAARAALFQGNQPLPTLALSTTQQLVLTATEKHIKARALAEAFASVPNELVEPPELHISMIEAEGEMVPPEAATLMISQQPVDVETKPRAVTLSAARATIAAFADLSGPSTPAVQPHAAKAKPAVARNEAVEKPRPPLRRVAETASTPRSALTARASNDGESFYDR